MVSLAPSVAPRSLVPQDLLACLFAHRMATTEQLTVMVDRHVKYVLHCLRGMEREGLVAATRRAFHSNVWRLTGKGRRLVARWPEFRAYTPQRKALPAHLSREVHTLTVTRTAVAFLTDARDRGDDFSPLDWSTEVAHPVRDGVRDGERLLIADGLLYYKRMEPKQQLLRAFVEVDRATESSERLASKTITYARLHAGAQPVGRGRPAPPAWQKSYTRFPRVLFVLTGASLGRLRQRIADLQTIVGQDPLVEHFAAQVPLGAAVLEELEERGASAPVWTPLNGRGERRGWMDL
ncbi:replication-relaxation family protein [Streptomyces nanshensis]|uniref:Protein involved in plasmid replication-relaxation n=1 Tax=Streptomyces nanshensis TaxID=518642 RepID=A0A1E7L400_9ACTN|nr:replication-relaxation family protein [Streptomyces nanshensis]OEV10917.1 hypothetical protein AN218_15365 [Streptomyces nanshensis]